MMKKMMLLWTGLAMVVCPCVAGAAFVEEYDVPWFAGTTVGSTDGNPSVDTAGNTWRYTQTSFGATPNWTTDAGRVSMQWGGSAWAGQTANGGIPSVDNAINATEARMSGKGTPYVGALEFTAAKSGTFSFTGSFSAYGPNGTGMYLLGAKQIGAGSASLLAEINVTGDGATYKTTNLDAITGLQDIALSAGDKLIFMVSNKSAGGYTYADLGDMSIGYVPEPATMGLLAMGGCGVLLRRRRR